MHAETVRSPSTAPTRARSRCSGTRPSATSSHPRRRASTPGTRFSETLPAGEAQHAPRPRTTRPAPARGSSSSGSPRARPSKNRVHLDVRAAPGLAGRRADGRAGGRVRAPGRPRRHPRRALRARAADERRSHRACRTPRATSSASTDRAGSRLLGRRGADSERADLDSGVTSQPTTITARAWSVWAVGLLVYLVAVFHRSSLAVAGLAATERFDISASQLATFTMLQLLVYAGMQIPVGLLVDRFGSRSVLLCGMVAADPRAGRVRRSPTATRRRWSPGSSSAWATR